MRLFRRVLVWGHAVLLVTAVLFMVATGRAAPLPLHTTTIRCCPIGGTSPTSGNSTLETNVSGASFSWTLNGTNLTVNDTSSLPPTGFAPAYSVRGYSVVAWWLSWGDGNLTILNGSNYTFGGSYLHAYAGPGRFAVVESFAFSTTTCLRSGPCVTAFLVSVASATVVVN